MGLLSDTLNPVPEGFKCDGIIGKVIVDGTLMPHDECYRVPAAAAAGSGVPTTALLIGGAVAAVGAGIIISNNSGTDEPISRSRPAAASPAVSTGSVK